MSSVQEFVCYDCSHFWRDKYSFWNGYQSACPLCGRSCEAVCDTQAFADQKEMRGLYDRPLCDFRESYGKTEADLEAERDLIHDEIVEALGAAELTSDTDEDGDSDEDGDAEGGASGDGL